MLSPGSDQILEPLLAGRRTRHAILGGYDPEVGTSRRSEHNDSPGWLGTRQAGGLPSSPSMLAGMLSGPSPDAKRGVIIKSMSKRSLAATRGRKMAWIVMDPQGQVQYVHADKRSITSSHGLRVPTRDMRLLDSHLVAADSTILVRDNAIIVSMDHVRVIIAAHLAILPRESVDVTPLAARFVEVLEEAVQDWARQRRQLELLLQHGAAGEEGDGEGSGAEIRDGGAFRMPEGVSDVEDDASITTRHEMQLFPFELVVLEAALKEVVACMSAQISELEGVAAPALDALMRGASSGNLERVRRVKTRHQRLSLRCEAVRDELQRFLQDDDDMARMALTRRREAEEAAVRATVAAAAGGVTDSPDALSPRGSTPPPGSMSHTGSLPRRSSTGTVFQRAAAAAAAAASAAVAAAGGAGGSVPAGASWNPTGFASHDAFLARGMGAAAEEEADADAQQDVENLLESYYMEVDALYDKLVSVGEYIKDTEEYINIELGWSRNRLIRIEIVLAVATFAIMPFNLLAGILGENLVIPDQITGSVSQFWTVNVVAGVACLLVFYAVVMYMRYRRLI